MLGNLKNIHFLFFNDKSRAKCYHCEFYDKFTFLSWMRLFKTSLNFQSKWDSLFDNFISNFILFCDSLIFLLKGIGAIHITLSLLQESPLHPSARMKRNFSQSLPDKLPKPNCIIRKAKSIVDGNLAEVYNFLQYLLIIDALKTAVFLLKNRRIAPLWYPEKL